MGGRGFTSRGFLYCPLSPNPPSDQGGDGETGTQRRRSGGGRGDWGTSGPGDGETGRLGDSETGGLGGYGKTPWNSFHAVGNLQLLLKYLYE